MPKKRRTGGAVAGIAAAVLVVGATAGGWYLLQDDEDGDTSAGPAFTTVSDAPDAPDAPGAPGAEDSEESDGADAESTVTTVTVTTSSGAENEEADETGGRSAEPRESSTGDRGNLNGGLSCDGRGVLIVNSVMGNSPGYDQEISDAVAQNPGAVVLEPGDCPSLRANVDGTTVTPVVIDYGDDRSALCAAEAQGRGNARLLNDDRSYTSPC
ncbi:MAG TPA: hypothetical protein H9870_04165 [Candidatus Corynebacterium avicola]|uniref:Uncharacterized protein n=1 Tax=Candidatus Corynebacterium avicola TaxID=2838527 RepID=A0A9D1RNU1_9CORY|nr:hypothetical protein [Candidatus Corynebacterium avicola]